MKWEKVEGNVRPGGVTRLYASCNLPAGGRLHGLLRVGQLHNHCMHQEKLDMLCLSREGGQWRGVGRSPKVVLALLVQACASSKKQSRGVCFTQVSALSIHTLVDLFLRRDCTSEVTSSLA